MGMFGWCGSLYVFGVLSRAICRHINIRLRVLAVCVVYCDDFMGISPTETALRDSQICQKAIEGTFGIGSACKKKSVPPCVATDLIGWDISLPCITIRPNRKGVKSLTRAFCSVTTEDLFSIKQFQTMASLACRYSTCLRGMRMFVRPLFLMTHGKSHRKHKHASTAAKIAILMWQTVAACLLCHPDKLSMDIRVVARLEASSTILAISDAGPDDLGLALYTSESKLIGFLSYIFPFQARDPRYQNAR